MAMRLQNQHDNEDHDILPYPNRSPRFVETDPDNPIVSIDDDEEDDVEDEEDDDEEDEDEDFDEGDDDFDEDFDDEDEEEEEDDE
jgi:hypothetical protein